MKILLASAFILGILSFASGQVKSPPILLVNPTIDKIENAEAVKFYNSGIELTFNGQYDLAIAEFTKVIERVPNFADAYNRRGRVYANKKDSKQAIKDFSKAIELNPKFEIAYMNRGFSYLAEEEYKSAVTDFSKLIEFDPKFAMYYEFRADAYEESGRKDLADADRRQAGELRKSK